jgi:hypothetical protein
MADDEKGPAEPLEAAWSELRAPLPEKAPKPTPRVLSIDEMLSWICSALPEHFGVNFDNNTKFNAKITRVTLCPQIETSPTPEGPITTADIVWHAKVSSAGLPPAGNFTAFGSSGSEALATAVNHVKELIVLDRARLLHEKAQLEKSIDEIDEKVKHKLRILSEIE